MSISSNILFYLGVAWCLLWAWKASRGWILPTILCCSGALHWLLIDSGFYRDTEAFPPPQLALVAPMVLGLAVVIAIPGCWRWLSNTNMVALTALHILRLPVELVLHDAYLHHLVPRSMTYSGHNFDIFTGISALFLTAWLVSRKPPGRNLLIGWNIAGLVLLGVVVFTAVFSIPSSIQRWAFDQPNVLVLGTPGILLPAMLVPAVLWAHVAALVKLLGKGRSVAV